MKIPRAVCRRAACSVAAFLLVCCHSAFLASLAQATPLQNATQDYQRALDLLKKKKYEQAETLLRQVTAADSLFQEPSGRSAWRPLGMSMLAQNRIGDAMHALDVGYRAFYFADKREPYLAHLLAQVYARYQKDERKQEITSLFYDALEFVQPERQPDLWQAIYDQSEFLLSDLEKQAIAQALEEKGAPGKILLDFFQANDLEPFTAENEFLIAYLRRVAEASQKYYHPRVACGFDDRGKIYVRFGKPDRIVNDRSGEMGDVGWKIRPYEVWFYEKINADMYFTFTGQSDNQDFRLVDGPESIFGTFYRRRHTMFNRKVASVGETVTALRDELYTSLAPWHKTFRERLFRLSTTSSLSEAADYAKLYFSEEDRSHSRHLARDVPTIVLDDVGDANLLPIACSHAIFRENQHTDRLEIYYSTPYRALTFESVLNGYKARVRGKLAVFDAHFQRVATDSIEQILYEKKRRETERGDFLSQFNVRLPAGDYHAVLQIEDVYGNRKGFVRFPLNLPTFEHNKLAVSDIQLSPHIQETAENIEFAKNGVLVAPLPTRKLAKNKALYLYYEIYHLQLNTHGEVNYRVEYRLRSGDSASAEEDGHAITVGDQRQAAGTHQAEFLSMDVSRFQAGEAVLEIYVTDLNSDAVAFSETRLTLEK